MWRCVSVCACVWNREGSGGSQSLDQVQFVSLLTGEDWGFFVVFNKLFHRVELALSNAVKVFLQLHFKMLVLALRLQGDGEVVRLSKENISFHSVSKQHNKQQHITGMFKEHV